MNRTQRQIASAEKWNKVQGVSPEYLKKVNDLFRTPVIAVPVLINNSPDTGKANDTKNQNNTNKLVEKIIKEGEKQ
ncbi:MAG: hypothetical protein WCO44_10290 [Bacteroidota bacterium]